MYYPIVTFFTGSVVRTIVFAMDYYPVYHLAKSNFERRMEAKWINLSSGVRFLSIACANFHDRLHLSQFFAVLAISCPVRTKVPFHEENGSRSVYPAFHLQAGAQVYGHIYFFVPRTGLDACKKSRPQLGFAPRAGHPLASRYSPHMNKFLRSREHHCNKYQVSK
jgi:hypothetical protein